jgi:hypothetical protein
MMLAEFHTSFAILARNQSQPFGRLQMPNELPAQPTPKRTWSISEASAVLGISKWRLRTGIRRGEITASKLNNRYVLPDASVRKLAGLAS